MIASIGPSGVFGRSAARFFKVVIRGKPNLLTEQAKVRGYYEQLVNPVWYNPALALTLQGVPDHWFKTEQKLLFDTGDLGIQAFRANSSVLAKGVSVHINAWGMRDREHDLIAKSGVSRIAILGTSVEAGSGVSYDESFKALLERALSSEYEVLNFSKPHSTAATELFDLEFKVAPFKPAVVLVFSHAAELASNKQKVVTAVRQRVKISYPEIARIVTEARLDAQLSETDNLRRLYPFGEELLLRTYQAMIRICRENGFRPVLVYLPPIGDDFSLRLKQQILASALAAGFEIIDLSEVFEGHDPDTLTLAPWDSHPNSLGHQLIAEKLLIELKSKNVVLEKRH